MQILYGIHPVEEALKAGKRRFDHVLVARERRDDRLEAIVSLCRELKIRVRTEPRETLTDMARTPAHQGVVAIVRAQQFLTIEDVLEPTGSPRLVLALDGVEDPQNLGALLRSADGAGVDSVVMTERRAAPLSAVAAKAAAGAQEQGPAALHHRRLGDDDTAAHHGERPQDRGARQLADLIGLAGADYDREFDRAA